jgi:hypothetical protein
MTKSSHKYAIVEERLSEGDDFFENLGIKESDLSPNKLYYRNDVRKIWLYQANCLELMDAIIA